jgi:hypothetical protein
LGRRSVGIASFLYFYFLFLVHFSRFFAGLARCPGDQVAIRR